SFLSGIAQNPDVPESVSTQASVELSSGVPFVSDAQLEAALETSGVDAKTTQEIVDVNERARLDGLRSALALLAIIAMAALLFAKRIPTRQPGVEALGDAGG
ncbi:MAG TPA: MFS transporter, partial [Actinomycetota bacterium]|nr:MFS transporter [Actinomycetota bacterium]